MREQTAYFDFDTKVFRRGTASEKCIGSPIWYGTYAPPVAGFFKTHSFVGKTVVPFCTHGGGGAGRYFVDVRKACPAATVKEGLTIRGSNQVERRLGTGVTVHHTEDFFGKIVVRSGYMRPMQDDDGIMHVGLIPFLLEPEILSAALG